MLKKILVSTMVGAVMLGLSGCGGSTPEPNSTNVYLSNGKTLAYAHMENGNKLLKISSSSVSENSDIEIIKITDSGFYPDYYMSSREAAGDKSPGCLVHMSDDDEDLKFCRSNYTGRTALSSGVSVLWNAAATVTTVGLNVATGSIADPKFFDKDKFLKIVKENNLPEIRQKLVDLYQLSRKNSKELDNIYSSYYNNYKNNISNINFTYNIEDKSELLPSKTLDANYKIVLNAPAKKSYSYDRFIDKIDTSAENFDNVYASISNNIQSEFKEDKEKYKIYLETSFVDYVIRGAKDYTFKHNKHISFNSTIKAPSKIKYILNKKITIPVNITIESASLNKMFPKDFVLQDNNLEVNFHTNNNNSMVKIIASNNTQSFINTKSLTSYYGKSVYNLSDVNREIAPKSTTLSSNSNYDILSDEMIEFSNFSNVTKSKAKSIILTYGYAVKYRINNTNQDKSLYKTNKYSLHSIIKQYI